MRVGIMGGTLDPVHNGHIQMAQAALRLLKLDRVMLLPAGDPPHKSNPTLKTDRLEMVRLAASEADGLFPCSMEVLRQGTTYTVDTLKQLTANNPSVIWYYIIGADTLDVLDTWRNFEEVAKLCIFAVFGRAKDEASLGKKHQLESRYGAKFEIMPVNGPDISSTQVRRLVAEGGDIRSLVPASVCDYIKKQGLYLSAHPKEEILEMLKADLKPERYKHTLGVAQTAKRLAGYCGVDPERAEMAAILHDCAKYMPLDQMRALVSECVADADKQELETISVLHAPAGAVLAEKKYGVKDPEILSAIRKHTLGAEHMSTMDALIYTADFIEPNRKEFPGLKEARQLAESNIFAAARLCAELTNKHLIEQGGKPHPRSIAMLKSNL